MTNQLDAYTKDNDLKGWQPIIATLHVALIKLDPDYRLVQVKEKFGTLRIYFDTETDSYKDMEGLVDKAETDSGKVCEWCGKEADQMREHGGWWKTLCVECHKKREAGFRPWYEICECGEPSWRHDLKYSQSECKEFRGTGKISDD